MKDQNSASSSSPSKSRRTRRHRSRSDTRSPKTSGRDERRRPLRQDRTRIQLRQTMAHAFQRALNHLQRYNRSRSLDEKFDEVQAAIKHLEACLEIEPGNRYLRLQLRICQGELQEIINRRSLTHQEMPIVLDPNWWKPQHSGRRSP